MPSARELLEQADALMRRNRSRDTMSPAMGPRTMAPMTTTRKAAPGDFPVLTESMDAPASALAPATAPAPAAPAAQFASAASVVRQSAAPAVRQPGEGALPSTAETSLDSRFRGNDGMEEPALRGLAEPIPRSSLEAARIVPSAADASRATTKAFADVPVLTDVIEEIDAALIAAADEGVPSIWNDEAMQGDDSVLGPAPKSIAVIPDSREIDQSRARDAQNAAAAAAAAAADESAAASSAAASSAAASSAVAASTAELIDEVRMQVLQRIDMFTDTGLRDQLGERLKPIVDRASAELVATINQHVGELLRTYVAEAIERELDRLRNEVR